MRAAWLVFWWTLGVSQTPGCAWNASLDPTRPTHPTRPTGARSARSRLHDRVHVLQAAREQAALLDALELMTGQLMAGQLGGTDEALRSLCRRHQEDPECSGLRTPRAALCSDEAVRRHVESVIDACARGACRELDTAADVPREAYRLLTTKVPHQLVLFRSRGTELDAPAEQGLRTFVARSLRTWPHAEFVVVGRASPEGSWRNNATLAIARARSAAAVIAAVLTERGVGDEHVGYITYGHRDMYITKADTLALENPTASEAELNRSAVVFVYPCRSS